jgi:hypothetical protein
MQLDLDRFVEALADAIAVRMRAPPSERRSPLRTLSTSHRESITLFANELKVGRLPRSGSTSSAALVTDVFALYRSWCIKNGRAPIGSMPLFAFHLRSECGFAIQRKRYRSGDGTLGPHSIATWRPISLELSENELAALGRHVQRFRDDAREPSGRSKKR